MGTVYGFTSGSYPVRNPSTGGGIDVVWKKPVLAVPTGELAPLDADLKLVNGISVAGTGTTIDLWGP